MAVTVTVDALAGAIRAGSTALETAEITRIREYAIEAIGRHLGASYDDAPETVLNEATIRLTGYIYDKPTSARGAAWANAGRNSGAWSTLLPYVINRAGGTAEATAAAQAAVGSADNPVIEVTVDAGAGTITVSFADGTTRTDTLPAGMGGSGIDQDARDAAAAAQGTADSAESRSESNAAKLMPPAPAEATNGTATAIRGWTAALIRTLVEAVAPARDSVIGVEDGRLPGPPIAMRLGWNQSRTMTAAVFTRANDHPIDGAVSGMSDGLAAPPFPPALDTDPSLYLGIWLAGDPDIADIPSGFPVADKRALTVDGTAGHYFPSSNRLAASVTGTVYRIVIAGPRILTENDLADLGGGTPTVQVDEVPMTGGTFGTLGAGRTFRMPYPTGTTRASYQGKVVDAHVFAAVTGHFMQGSRVLTLSGAALWLSEGTTGNQWNVILRDDGIRLFIPFAVDAVAITSATVYLARLT